MKKIAILFVLLSSTLGYWACKKEGSAQSNNGSLTAAKTSSIAKGEPVVFSLENAGNTVSWSVSPSLDVRIKTSGGKAAILFGRPGNYLVNAVAGASHASQTVHVMDSVYNPGDSTGHGGDTTGHGHGGDSTGHGDTLHHGGYTLVPLTGDQIHITLSRFGQADSAGLVISAVTTNSYNCLNNMLRTTLADTAGGYLLFFNDVWVPTGSYCTGGQAPATSFNYLMPVSNGTHLFEVVLNGTIYTGSFVKNGSTFTFTWPYSSGVTITPLVIN